MDEIIQMHDDFTLLPFQASECCLASISPLDGEKCFSEEFVTALEQLTPSSTPVQIQAIDYNDAKPLVNLYTYHNNMMCYVNKELVDMGLAQWTPKNKNSG
uniref:Uncharacterized protein LOC102805085 n=1 Tax=Saccoglossus kowalevskii TaxID=10224 RepID=A0ABM0MD23_SACKO|nr:PREDICTED: uncharacterized protein LOC102805085 [Saccoglossus kowalevskii]